MSADHRDTTADEVLVVCLKLQQAIAGEHVWATLVAFRMLRHYAVETGVITKEQADEADKLGDTLCLKAVH